MKLKRPNAMRFMNLFLMSLILLLSHSICSAKVFKLECTDKDGFVMQFTIDDTRETVLSSGAYAKNVFIDDDRISFLLQLGDESWFHTISRHSGRMTVRREATQRVLEAGFRCSPVSIGDRKF
jgi:hypothetical protein